MKGLKRLCLATLAAAGLLAGHAMAEGDGIKDSLRKTERGFGELLKGMGQELKKAGDAVGAAVKKDDKAAKSANKQTSKGDRK